MKYYCQCEMKKELDKDMYKVHVAWIPEKYAKAGKYIKIKQEDGAWDDHWLVTSVGCKKEASSVEINSRDYLKQREASDI